MADFLTLFMKPGQDNSWDILIVFPYAFPEANNGLAKSLYIKNVCFLFYVFNFFKVFFDFANLTFCATTIPQYDIMCRLDFLIQTSSGVLFNVLACGFQVLHLTLVYQVFCLEDQNLSNILKHFQRLKMFIKFLWFLEVILQSAKYLLWVEQMFGSICKHLTM